MQQTLISSAPDKAVNRAFSKQSLHYDDDDSTNLILVNMRRQVYDHVQRQLKPGSRILELNAGTGIDAVNFVNWGHQVLATDLSDGMVAALSTKILENRMEKKLSCKQLSYENLDELNGEKFDFVFSNFGGLNCTSDLSAVTKFLPSLLNPGAKVTWVIMPRVYLWDLFGFFFGHGQNAFKRLKKNGVVAHLEGEYFKTYYHNLSDIKRAFGNQFKLVELEGLAALSPPPHRQDFPLRFPRLYKFMRGADQLLRYNFPFNRWADHIIVTFEYAP